MAKNRFISLFFLAFVLCTAIASCSKDNFQGSDLPYISFKVSSIGVDTKGLIQSSQFESGSLPVRIYGVRNNREQIYNNALITKESGNSNWMPDQKKQWIAGSSYSFYGYTCSGNCDIANSGLQITVSQPQSYSPYDMVDYMLSHAYKVADGSNFHTVELKMQHAMACVDIAVYREENSHAITVDSIVLRKIYRSAVMQCEQQAIAPNNSDANNVWTIKLEGTNDIVYSDGPFQPTANHEYIGGMTFLAIPQQLSSEAVLKVAYSVDEDNNNSTPAKVYSQTFNLFNYIPYVWESGHKINYTLTINTGVQLDATVSDWTDAGYTEGVILPKPVTP